MEAPEAPKVGKYGMLRRSYLQTHRNAYYTGMLLSGRLNAHLEKIDRQATEMVEQLTARMAREQGVTEELKASDQMKWVGLMNNIRAAAEELALTDNLYGRVSDPLIAGEAPPQALLTGHPVLPDFKTATTTLMPARTSLTIMRTARSRNYSASATP
ncbi:MAG: TnpV protein [Flavonifractor plautii]